MAAAESMVDLACGWEDLATPVKQWFSTLAQNQKSQLPIKLLQWCEN